MRSATRQDYEQRILRVLLHIQQHLDEAISLRQLAEVAHFSACHFHRIFRGMVGESLKQHIRRLRLERAAVHLKNTADPVLHIALDAGYETHESFTRAFRAMFGESPSAFRKANRQLSYQAVPSGVHYVSGGGMPDCRFGADGPPPDVRIRTIEPIRVAFVRHVGPYDEVAPAWQQLMAWAGRRGLLGPNAAALGIVHDDPDVTAGGKIRYDACLVVDHRCRGEGNVGVQEIRGGEYAVTTHCGPYGRPGETYARLCGRWLPDSGRRCASAPAFEVYRNSIRDTAPEELRTDIHLPLEPVAGAW